MTDVKGYTPLNEQQKDLANEGKVLEERYLRFLDKLDKIIAVDKRCAALARTNMQLTSMWATRAIFQPTRIKLPEDDLPNPERNS